MSGDPFSYQPCTCASCRPTFTPINGMETRPHPSIGLTVDAPIAPGPGVFDVAEVTRWRPEPPRLHPADVEAIARRVAELLRGAP